MNALVSLGRFVWEFIVGDDWRLAVGVAAALGVTAAIATTSIPAWWLVPAAVALLLAFSLRGTSGSNV